MDKKRLNKILQKLDEHYGKEHVCYLNYSKPYELLIATMLSAQCTDDRVNKVTKELFVKYNSIEAFMEVELSELEKDIHSTGFYRNKAKNIKSCVTSIIKEHNGEVPANIEPLIKLAGVGRKTANVFLGHIHNVPCIVVDTHVKRLSNKLGLTKNKDAVKIEYDLMEILPKDHWLRINTQLIAHGRSICTARSPKCGECFLLATCPYGLENQLNKIKEEN